MSDTYMVRLARASEIPRLRAIEDAAGALFTDLGLHDDAIDSSFPLEDRTRFVELGQTWVACLDNDVPVGVVVGSARGELGYVEELDVVPSHGRRGLGTRLLAHVCAWARAQGLEAMTLSTFRDVPWNGPFYRKRGFKDLPPSEWTPWMRAVRDWEAEHGLVVDARVIMRLDWPEES
jgi:GNAT superfamily N-acetyltransferase